MTATMEGNGLAYWRDTIPLYIPADPTANMYSNVPSADPNETHSLLNIRSNYGRTSWKKPLYVRHHFSGSEDWSYDPTIPEGNNYTGSGGSTTDDTDYYMVNEHALHHRSLALNHYTDPDTNRYIINRDREISGSLPVTAYKLVTMPPMTIAYVITNPPVYNLEPLPGCPTGKQYKDSDLTVALEETYNVTYETVDSSTGEDTTVTNAGSYSIDPIMGARTINWYNSPEALTTSGYGTARDSISAYLTANEYTTNSGALVGYLVTYEVVEAHPGFAYSTNDETVGYNYVFQVAAQLGRELVRVPIFGAATSLAPPTIVGTPIGPITIPVNTPTEITGISVTDTLVTGGVSVEIEAVNGTITLVTSNGLTSIFGDGTGKESFTGLLSDVNIALGDFRYRPNTNFSGVDIIRIIFDDLGHNGTGVPQQLTTTFEILVNPGLSGEKFVLGTNFQFMVTGANGSDWTISASTNLTDWVDLDIISITNGTSIFIETNAASYPYRFYRASQGEMQSDCVGFMNITIPGMTSPTAGGLGVVANQLINPAGNTLPVIMSNVPDGTTVYIWNDASHSFANTDLFISGTGGWLASPPTTLNPGQGVMVQNPTTTPFTITFIGSVMQGSLTNPVVSGTSIRSAMVPQSAGVDVLGYSTPSYLDTLYRWDVSSQSWATSYLYTGSSWVPSIPVLNVGEPVYLDTPAANNWNLMFSIWP